MSDKNENDINYIHWQEVEEALEKGTLDGKKIDLIYDNAIKLAERQQDMVNIHRQKAKLFLTVCISLFTVVFIQIIQKDFFLFSFFYIRR